MRGKIKDMLSIHERPIEVADRTIPGHWEGDLIIGKYKRTAIATLVERTTRYTMLVPLPDGKDAVAVRKALAKKLKQLPLHLKKTLTYDQGKEMSDHKQFTINTGIQVYFADPASPWQRGTNENTNGLIRQFFPKGTDFSLVTKRELQKAEDLLNGRPRKCIGYKFPKDVFYGLVALDC
jgi:IS30 family transposase